MRHYSVRCPAYCEASRNRLWRYGSAGEFGASFCSRRSTVLVLASVKVIDGLAPRHPSASRR